jgi:hypothetical protein
MASTEYSGQSEFIAGQAFMRWISSRKYFNTEEETK